MDTQTIKQGDFVRLTDPIDNGTIVRIENVDENGFAEWLGGSQYCNMEQIPCEFEAYPIGENSLANYYETLSDVISDLESKIGVKLYPESALNYYKQRAEKEAKEHAYYEKSWEKEHNKLLDAQDEIEKLKEELSRCRAKNAAYLREKKQAENKAELLEKEVADLKVPESRRERHLQDELHKVRIECQQAWGECNEELVNKATVESELQRVIAERDKYRNSAIELGDKNDALKRQLDESNKQIEIYAKKVRNLEADIEEGGFNDERNFI